MGWFSSGEDQELLAELQGKLAAIEQSQATIEFNLDGTIITANNNFLDAMGYRLDEVVGRHHSMFVEPEYKSSAEYRQFWDKLNRGEFESGEYKRLAKGAREIWIQASYNPIKDKTGKPYKVMKVASDITKTKIAADQASVLKICNANVMLADNDLNIIYMNDSVTEMLQKREQQLQTALPNFRVSDLIGTCVDDFHVNPAHQRAMIKNLKEVYKTKLPVAGLTFDLIATPWTNPNGERLGTVVEWQDVTEQLAAEEEAQELATANARIKLALDKCQANVMLADNDLNVVYMNETVLAMMKRNENELRKTLPNFTADNLIGTCVDDFHVNPAHQRSMLTALNSTYETQIKVGVLTFDLVANPVIDENGVRQGTVVEWSDVTQKLADEAAAAEVSAANARIKIALDKCQTNVMLADADLNIIYMNGAVTEMMRRNESKLQTVLPNFKVSELIGTCVDDFHKNPAHQRGMLENLTQVYNTRLPVAGLTFDLTASPVFDEDGTRLGTIVEWDDITEKLAADEAAAEISAANARIKIALDKCQANVMMADTDLNIIYLNDSVREMMQGNEATLRTALPNFSVKDLIGTCVDDFHKNPAHQRGMLENLKDVYQTRLPVAGLTFDLVATPVFDGDTRLGTIVEWDDVTQRLADETAAAEIANNNARIKIALDKCQANVMMADNDLNIIYTNDAVQAMMSKNESALRTALPNFNAAGLIGTCVDDFHKNPAHQRGMIERLKTPYSTPLEVGGLTFSLVATPVFDETNTRLGTIVEWSDRTAEVAVENEVQDLVDAVNRGELDKSIPTGDKEGFFLNVSEGLNKLSETVNEFMVDLNDSLTSLAEGRLDMQMENSYEGTYAAVQDNLNGTITKLDSVIANIAQGTDSIRSANEEINVGNDQLSERTEQQASNIEETAASLEELTSNVNVTAGNANDANSAASDARKQAEGGETIVKAAMQSMEEITTSSNKIVEIISVIDDIAFQTNLLALNASVEAARAGEQGRGFAVVATEVRNLAQRSAVSAKEIKELIDDSSTKVAAGSQQVNDCGESLSTILDHVDKLSELISDIASSTNEQASGISQVNQAVAELDDITQQNAALAEETASASQASYQQAGDMVGMVQYFTTTIGHTGMPAAAPVAPAPVAKAPKARAAKPKAKAKAKPAKKAKATSNGNAGDDEQWTEF